MKTIHLDHFGDIQLEEYMKNDHCYINFTTGVTWDDLIMFWDEFNELPRQTLNMVISTKELTTDTVLDFGLIAYLATLDTPPAGTCTMIEGSFELGKISTNFDNDSLQTLVRLVGPTTTYDLLPKLFHLWDPFGPTIYISSIDWATHATRFPDKVDRKVFVEFVSNQAEMDFPNFEVAYDYVTGNLTEPLFDLFTNQPNLPLSPIRMVDPMFNLFERITEGTKDGSVSPTLSRNILQHYAIKLIPDFIEYLIDHDLYSAKFSSMMRDKILYVDRERHPLCYAINADDMVYLLDHWSDSLQLLLQDKYEFEEHGHGLVCAFDINGKIGKQVIDIKRVMEATSRRNNRIICMTYAHQMIEYQVVGLFEMLLSTTKDTDSSFDFGVLDGMTVDMIIRDMDHFLESGITTRAISTSPNLMHFSEELLTCIYNLYPDCDPAFIPTIEYLVDGGSVVEKDALLGVNFASRFYGRLDLKISARILTKWVNTNEYMVNNAPGLVVLETLMSMSSDEIERMWVQLNPPAKCIIVGIFNINMSDRESTTLYETVGEPLIKHKDFIELIDHLVGDSAVARLMDLL